MGAVKSVAGAGGIVGVDAMSSAGVVARWTDAPESAPRTEYRAEPRGIDPAEAVLPAVSSGHDVAESEYEPQYAGQTDLAPVEAVEPAAAA